MVAEVERVVVPLRPLTPAAPVHREGQAEDAGEGAPGRNACGSRPSRPTAQIGKPSTSVGVKVPSLRLINGRVRGGFAVVSTTTCIDALNVPVIATNSGESVGLSRLMTTAKVPLTVPLPVVVLISSLPTAVTVHGLSLAGEQPETDQQVNQVDRTQR